jgi:hypothetical protein
MAIDALPKVGSKAWFTLRSKATNAPSTKFTPTFVAASLGMANADSALGNIVRPMRALGIFEEDGSLTALGNKWRNDSTYADACEEILKKVYPAELAHLTESDGKPSASQVKAWLGNEGFGESNARQMSATYVMIASKDIPLDSPTPEAKKTPPAKKPVAQKQPQTKQEKTDQTGQQQPPPARTDGPGIHLDIQIHLPADASAEQIDSIFRSMAKHIYGRATD